MATGDGSGVLKGLLIALGVGAIVLLVCCGGAMLFWRTSVQPHIEELAGTPGSGVAITEAREVATFDRIVIEGQADVDVTVGPETSVTLTVDDNLTPMVKTEVVSGALVISSKESFSTRLGVRLTVTCPSLRGIDIRGAGDARIEGVSGPAFDVAIVGAGDVTVGGTADDVTITVAGAGDVDAADLVARRVTVTIAGVGDADVHATESLDATINGAGDIRYRGNPPLIDERINGVGDIEPR